MYLKADKEQLCTSMIPCIYRGACKSNCCVFQGIDCSVLIASVSVCLSAPGLRK